LNPGPSAPESSTLTTRGAREERRGKWRCEGKKQQGNGKGRREGSVREIGRGRRAVGAGERRERVGGEGRKGRKR